MPHTPGERQTLSDIFEDVYDTCEQKYGMPRHEVEDLFWEALARDGTMSAEMKQDLRRAMGLTDRKRH